VREKYHKMKILIVVALCVVAALAVPIDETQQVAQDESQITLVELEPEEETKDNADDAARVKRQFG
jgi:hypothetical protein